jgi:hypothetical protein
LISEPNANAIESIILEALQQGDKNRGQLFDLTSKSYPVLVQALQHLETKQLIESYFVALEGQSVLTYRLRSER